MIKIEKTQGVKDAANDLTIFRLQEVIVSARCQYTWVGKAIIDTEKITFSKFGMKLGLARHSTNGFVVSEDGTIRYTGLLVPVIEDRQILTDLYNLFNKKCPV